MADTGRSRRDFPYISQRVTWSNSAPLCFDVSFSDILCLFIYNDRFLNKLQTASTQTYNIEARHCPSARHNTWHSSSTRHNTWHCFFFFFFNKGWKPHAFRSNPCVIWSISQTLSSMSWNLPNEYHRLGYRGNPHRWKKHFWLIYKLLLQRRSFTSSRL